jgi:cupin superfamily acireductone dioxygenase involved in methionine salvage
MEAQQIDLFGTPPIPKSLIENWEDDKKRCTLGQYLNSYVREVDRWQQERGLNFFDVVDVGWDNDERLSIRKYVEYRLTH